MVLILSRAFTLFVTEELVRLGDCVAEGCCASEYEDDGSKGWVESAVNRWVGVPFRCNGPLVPAKGGVRYVESGEEAEEVRGLALVRPDARLAK